MEKDSNYWTLHKETYNEMMQELDTEVIRKIYSNPSCSEGRLLQKRVDRTVDERMRALQTK